MKNNKLNLTDKLYLLEGLYSRFAPDAVNDPNALNHWNEKVLYILVLVSIPLVLVMLILSSPSLIKSQYWLISFAVFGGYFGCIFIFLFPKISFVIRSVIACTSIYFVGVAVILTVGPFLASREWLISFSIIASILLGWSGAVTSISINTITWVLVGILINMGYWENLEHLDNALEYWYQVAIDLFFVNISTTILIASLFIRIQKSDRSAKTNSQLLLREKRKLIESKEKLELEIEERKKAQEIIKKSSEREKQLLDSIAAGILVVDRQDRRIAYANSTALSAFGSTEVNLLGKVCHDNLCLAEADTCPVIDLGEEIDCSERELLNVDGSTVPILKTVIPIVFHDRDCLLETFIDISDRKHLENQLAQSQKMQAIGTLAGGIAHDFNNILSAVIGYTELALIHAEKESDQYYNLQEVFRAGRRAKDLVDQILAFSRQSEQERKPVQLKLIAKEALKFLRASLPTTIEIRQDIQSDSLVMADPTQIHQVLMNLCTNAGHAMLEKGGVLGVKLADVELKTDFTAEHPELKPGPYLELKISDTGYGIPAHILDRIFDPFFTTKEAGEGTGMGLAVVHGIVGGCGGKILASSEPGQGATFKVYFPVVGRQLESQAGVEDFFPTGTERILFVDDEPDLAHIGKLNLESIGYKVTTRTSSLEALELFKAKPDTFDLVITDMTMPKMTGENLTLELMRIRPEIPVILCTGYSTRINEEQALSIGIRAFVSKPVLKKDIARTIRKVLDGI